MMLTETLQNKLFDVLPLIDPGPFALHQRGIDRASSTPSIPLCESLLSFRQKNRTKGGVEPVEVAAPRLNRRIAKRRKVSGT